MLYCSNACIITAITCNIAAITSTIHARMSLCTEPTSNYFNASIKTIALKYQRSYKFSQIKLLLLKKLLNVLKVSQNVQACHFDYSRVDCSNIAASLNKSLKKVFIKFSI
jgi:hypothetical protein